MIDTTDITTELRQQRDQLGGQLVQLGDVATLQQWGDGRDEADRGTAVLEREQGQAQLETARRRLAAIDDALDRLERGTYGTCVECDDPIAAERLEALPATATCRDCTARR